MAGQRTIVIRFDGSADGLDKATAGAKRSLQGVEQATEGTRRSLEQVGESTDQVATKSGTAAGAFGALASGVELSRLRALRHAEALQANVDQLKKQAEADGEVTDAEKARIEAAQEEADAAMKAATENNKLTDALLIGALATDALSGVADFATLALNSKALAFVKAKAALVAHTAATVASTAVQKTIAGATKAWAAVQWLLNAAMLANPIVLIVAGIVLLIGIIVLIATKTTWFQQIWGAAWGWIKQAALNVWDWLKGLPQMIGDAFSKVSDFITAPFRFAFNKIADLWNGSVGKLSFNVPDWVPGIGGKSFSLPQLPKLHSGGIVPGPIGAEVPILALGGERVLTRQQQAQGFGGAEVIELHLDLGHGIQQVVQVNLREHDRRVRRRSLAGAGVRV